MRVYVCVILKRLCAMMCVCTIIASYVQISPRVCMYVCMFMFMFVNRGSLNAIFFFFFNYFVQTRYDVVL